MPPEPAIAPPLAAVPAPPAKRLAVRVTPDALRQIRAGHPWVFDRSIVSVDGDVPRTAEPRVAPGALAVVFDDERRFAAIGLFDPASPIRVRVLHHGRPTTIDGSFFAARLVAAIERRAALLTSGDTNAFRVVHGENDGFPGLVLDRYDSTLVLKLYSAAWLPHLHNIVPAIAAALTPRRLIVRFSREVAGRQRFGLEEGVALIGDAPAGPVPFLERGLRLEADVIHGQKTGHFLDQRDNRFRVGSLARGLDVLDVFSCTGGFSVSAAAGGATSVISVDQSPHALATAETNLALNRRNAAVVRCHHLTHVGDAFDVLAAYNRQQRRFGMVIVDPPSFARRASDHDRALHAYRRLTRFAVGLVDNGGLLVQSSCSSRVGGDEFFDAIHGAARDTGARLTDIVRTGHAIDHPATFAESAYLKTLFARVHR